VSAVDGPTTVRGWEQHRAILEVLARYCECIDRYDLDGVAATFTEDAVTDYGPGRGGEVSGRGAIRERIGRGQAEFRRTHHQLGQVLVETIPEGVATTTYVTATHERWDGGHETACLRYVDRLVASDDGTWRIARRCVEASVIDGFPGVPWTWVERAQP
jgi:ketosteroid isomerase-like protein